MTAQTTTRKSTKSTSNGTRKATSKRSTKKAAATPAVQSKDWTYLSDKAPSELHETFAEWISAELGTQFDPKAVQIVLAMHPSFQRGERNKARSEYRPLDGSIVHQRSVHMTQAHVDAKAEREAAEAAAKAKAASRTSSRKAAAAARKAAREAASATA
jgi:hypothetical protein